MICVYVCYQFLEKNSGDIVYDIIKNIQDSFFVLLIKIISGRLKN